MDDCIFCKIIKGEVPCHKVYEDDNFLGFLDIRPLTKGNSLLVSKKHYRWVYDVPNFGDYWEAAKKVALSTIKTLGAERVTFLTLGMEVPHAHIRIIPRYKNDKQGDVPNLDIVEEIGKEEMRIIAEKIKSGIT